MLIAQLSDLHVRPDGMLYNDVTDSNAQLAALSQQQHAEIVRGCAQLRRLAPQP